MTTVTLSLISHTNVGKTTLARTLLRRDVGEVFDQAHVTEVSEAYTLIETVDDRLLLWDTPGLGDTARLLRRLRKESNPLGWFLHEVWDRVADRPLWSSQEAVRNVREDADVVLYLVNAAEDPGDAGYVPAELEILSLLGRPVAVLLNQTGEGGEHLDLAELWRAALGEWEIVRDVLSLDAFARSWVQEDRLFARLVDVLDGERREAMRRLARTWRERNLETFGQCMGRMGAHLARAATDRERVAADASRGEKRRAMESLARRLERSETELWDEVIAAHGLEGRLAAEVRSRLGDFLVHGEDALTPRRGAVLGGALSGAMGGLMADLLAGGLSFGGGLVAGTILGALGGAGLSHAARWVRGTDEPTITWTAEFLDVLARQTVLRYLAVSHFGRGRGELRDAEHAAGWRAAVDEVFERDASRWNALWSRGAEGEARRSEMEDAVTAELERTCKALFEKAYPTASALRDGP